MQVNEFKAEVVRHGMTLEEVAEAIGLNRSTIWRRLKNPGDFTITEIMELRSLLNLSGPRTLEIFFNDKVS